MIGLGADLAHVAGQLFAGLRPGFDRDRRTGLERGDAVFGDGDLDFGCAVPRERRDRQAGADDLARFGVDRGDEARMAGAQRRVLGLVLRDGERRLRLLYLRLRGLERVADRIELRLADEVLVEHRAVAVVFGLGEIAVRARRTQRRVRAGDLQFQIERVELGQDLAFLDVITDVDEARLDLAVDAETELALETRVDVTRIDLGIGVRGRLRMCHERIARRLRHSGLAAAARQHERYQGNGRRKRESTGHLF